MTGPAVGRRAAAWLVAVGLLAASCGTGTDTVEAPPLVTAATPADDGSGSAGTPAVTADGTAPGAALVEQVDCPDPLVAADLACGIATVPLDPDDPTGPTTRISIATRAGADPARTTPLVVLQGGPGGASTELAAFFPRRDFPQIFVDQRGTGFAGPDTDCVELDDRLVALFGLTSDEALELEYGAYAECAARLRSGPDTASLIDHTDTAHHAADVVAVMAALGHPRWAVYGVSYGTTIALEVLRRAPEGLVGAVLDGVYPPDIDVDAGLARSADRALAELDTACAADDSCRALISDVDATVAALMARFDADPVRVELGADETSLGTPVEVVFDGTGLAVSVFRFFYDERLLRFVPGVLAGLDAADDATARWFARISVEVTASSVTSNDEGTYFAVQCRDRLPLAGPLPTDVSAFARAVAAVPLADICGDWVDPPPATPASPSEPVASDLPVLTLTGRFDPITPPSYAEHVAATLERVTGIVRDGRGHGIWAVDECAGRLVDEFVADPLRTLDTSCADEPLPVDWTAPVRR